MKSFLVIFLIVHGIEMICGASDSSTTASPYQQPSENYVNSLIQKSTQHQHQYGQENQQNSQENQVSNNYQQPAFQNQFQPSVTNQPTAPARQYQPFAKQQSTSIYIQNQRPTQFQTPGQYQPFTNQHPAYNQVFSNNQPTVQTHPEQYQSFSKNQPFPVNKQPLIQNQYQEPLGSQPNVENQHPAQNQPSVQNQYPIPNQLSGVKQTTATQSHPSQQNKSPQVSNNPQSGRPGQPQPSQQSVDNQLMTTTYQEEEDEYHQPNLNFGYQQSPWLSPPIVPSMDFAPMGPPMGYPQIKPRQSTGVLRPVPPFTQPFY